MSSLPSSLPLFFSGFLLRFPLRFFLSLFSFCRYQKWGAWRLRRALCDTLLHIHSAETSESARGNTQGVQEMTAVKSNQQLAIKSGDLSNAAQPSSLSLTESRENRKRRNGIHLQGNHNAQRVHVSHDAASFTSHPMDGTKKKITRLERHKFNSTFPQPNHPSASDLVAKKCSRVAGINTERNNNGEKMRPQKQQTRALRESITQEIAAALTGERAEEQTWCPAVAAVAARALAEALPAKLLR